MEPRLLKSVLPSSQPPTNNVGRIMRRMDADMKGYERLDREDLQECEQVTLYNQVLQRYNDIDDIREQQPERVAVVNSEDYKAPDKTVGQKAAAAAVAAAPVGGVEAEIVENVPKSVTKKAQQFVEKLKADFAFAWNYWWEFLREGFVVIGSSMVDLLNDGGSVERRWIC